MISEIIGAFEMGVDELEELIADLEDGQMLYQPVREMVRGNPANGPQG